MLRLDFAPGQAHRAGRFARAVAEAVIDGGAGHGGLAQGLRRGRAGLRTGAWGGQDRDGSGQEGFLGGLHLETCQIGRASWRERGEISVVAGSLKKKKREYEI